MDKEVDRARFLSLRPDATKEQADEYISNAGGDVDLAVALFSSVVPATGAPARAPPPKAAPAKASVAPAKQPPPKGSNTYFAGGGPSSGQAVVGRGRPPAPDDSDDEGEGESGAAGMGGVVGDIFAKARANGASEGRASAAAGTLAFTGAGRRLGHTEGPSPAMAPVRATERTVRITFYREGRYQLDDEPALRDPTTAAGAEFLDTLNRGFVPKELVDKYPGAAISVELVDRSGQDFVPPKYTPYGGSGRALGATSSAAAPATSVATPATSAAAAPAAPRAPAPAAASASPFVLRDDEEKCMVRFQKLTGGVAEFAVNPLRHTVRDLVQLATTTTPGLLADAIELIARDMPPRPLRDLAQTVDAARCRNALLIIKKK